MGFKDVREWMNKLESEGELKRIKVEVDWNREIGAIARKVSDKMGPALLFENIKDYKIRSIDKPMPIAVAFNWDPAMKYVAAASVPAGVCEYDVMGGVRQEPVPLVKCETVDLEVPAWAEIVIEETVLHDPDTFAWDGPFGEYTGYYGGTKTLSPVMKVECITYRNDPIYTFALVGVGPGHPEEAGIMMQISGAAVLWNSLEAAGVPGVKDLYPLPASYGQTVAVQIHKTYLGQAKQVAMALWSTRFSEGHCKNVIVVDDDIDVYDFEALEWAIAYRVNPGENDIVVIPGTHGSVLDPSVRVKDREPRLGTAKWNRLLIDATKNWEYEPQEQYGGDIYPPVAFLLDPEDEALMEKRWKEYGLEG